MIPKTICAQCKHHLFEGTGWYDQFCMANPHAKGIDPVTGKEEYVLKVLGDGTYILTHDKYPFCRGINNGACPDYARRYALLGTSRETNSR